MSEMTLVERDYAWSANSGRVRASSSGGQRNAELARSIRIAVVAFLSVAAFVALVYLLIVPAMVITRFDVLGSSTMRADELRAWTGLPEKPYWFSLDCAAVEGNLLEHPRVAGVVVERVFPNRLKVSVTERNPVAVVYARGASGRTEAHCVDGKGFVFASASAYAHSSGLPVLSGLEIHGLRYGLRLDGAFLTILSSLDGLQRSEPALLSAISELRVVTREGSPSELLIYPARYRIPVRVRPALDAGLLKSILLVLDVVEGEGLAPAIRELDMRTDTYVYRTKEAVSG
jgi:cell division protein FtsQ